MIGWQTDDTIELIENIKRYNFGNIILFTRNIKSANQITDVCGKIQEAAVEYNGHPCFISLDQEGGSVRRIYEGVTSVPGSMAIAAASGKYPDAANQIGRIIGQDLKKLGINMNLAPVVDINTNPFNPVIAIRSYGDDPAFVAKLSEDFVHGVQEAGVMACCKHFLGHGDVDVDSHLELPRLKKSIDEIEMCELVPYKGKIADSIMSVHILYTALDDRFPASISEKILRGILRERLGFKGLIVTDCFEMDGLMRTFSLSEAAVFAANATTDMITISHTFGRQLLVRNGLLSAVRDGCIKPQTIDDAVTRILGMKEKYCGKATIHVDDKKNQEIATRISEASISIISGEPFQVDDNTVCIGVTNYVNSIAEDVNVEKMDIAEIIGKEFGIEYHSIDNKNFNLSETLSLVGKRKVVLCLSDSHLTLVQKVLYSSLMQRKAEVMLISLRTPYDILNQDKPKCHICTFEYTRQSCDALLRVLRGNPAYGICPVKLDRKFDGTMKNDGGSSMVERVVKYIKQNYSKRLTLDTVAEEFMITGGHLCKLLKKKINRSFVDIVNEVRIGESKRLLTTTDMKVYEISSLVGFNDLEYFTHVFKKYNGVTPTYFRNNYNIND